MNLQIVKRKIRNIPNFPEKGVIFRDITPALQDRRCFKYIIDKLAQPYLKKKIDLVVGIDARGFILAAALAYKLKAGLALIRKKGKLPHKTVSQSYHLEYAENTIEMHRDSIKKGQKVLLVDDVLATGGTMKATIDIVKKLGGKIMGVDFLVVLSYLPGLKKLKKYNIKALITF